ncbi:tetraspanin-3 [Striga asiatica]|uniref:Tetraspanin-3 n=1 Tax=Striga asiatica TaxID=4170 RepID=A0A5A7QQU2_STRAF|nr:tetraspanin-3 [Striga asiatica]
MSTVPRFLLTVLNVGILIYGVYHVAAAGQLSKASSLNECLRDSSASIRRLGVLWSVIAAVGIAGAWSDVKALQYIYVFALVFSTAAAVFFSLFVWSAMPKTNADEVFYRTSVHGNWLDEYSTAAQKGIANDRDFTAATDCLDRTESCRAMRNMTEDQKAVFMDFGCCSPPNRCGLLQDHKGRWVVAPYGLNSTDDECQMWAKVGGECFECDSCKAGYLGNYQRQWDNNMNTRVKSILVLVAASALAYYIFIDEPYREGIKEQKRGKFLSINV